MKCNNAKCDREAIESLKIGWRKPKWYALCAPCGAAARAAMHEAFIQGTRTFMQENGVNDFHRYEGRL